MKGLLKNGTFIPVSQNDIEVGARIYVSRFIDELKTIGEQLLRKSRPVAQNYDADAGAAPIATKALTIQRFSQLVAFSIAASMKTLHAYTRDVIQAYVQARKRLERRVYIRVTPELGLPEGTVLEVVKPLYGIPDSGLHWYLTYLSHHIDKLEMTRSKSDPCVLFRRSHDGLDEIILLQVDDALGIGTNAFIDGESEASKEFQCKERTMLTEKPVKFNGIQIRQQSTGEIEITQTDKVERLKMPKEEKEFTSQRALAQYVGVNTRPDICTAVQLLTPGHEATMKEEFTAFKKTLQFLQSTKTQGLKYVALNLERGRFVLVTDASFTNDAGSKSQLGYVIMMVDKH